jgi:O-antigen/teichoic acid export membrane protein
MGAMVSAVRHLVNPFGATGIARAGAPRHGTAVSLRVRVVAGLGWTGAVHWCGVLLATATTAVVARHLVPADYAIVVAAGAVAGLVGVVQESGLAAAVVQDRGDPDRSAATALALHVAGATLGLAGCLAAVPWIADFFQIDRPGALAAAFAPLWLRAWTVIPSARLQRALDFRRTAMIEAAQLTAYPAVAIPCAWAGLGAWALVLGQGAGAAAGAAAAWAVGGWWPRLADIDRETARRLLRYGRPLVWANLLGMTNDRIDNWVTGRVLGPAALGLYAMAFRLATLPRTGFSFVLSRVMFPAMAAIRDDPPRLRSAYLRGVHWVAALAIPSCIGMAVVAPELVQVVLGARWADTVAPLRVLAAFGLCAALASTTGDVFKAVGRSRLIFTIGLVHTAVLWSGLFGFASRGLAWVALAVSAAGLASSSTALVVALRLLGIRPLAFARALGGPVAAAAVMAAAVSAARAVDWGSPAVELGALVAAGAVAYVGTLAALAPDDRRELAAVIAGWRARRRPTRLAA